MGHNVSSAKESVFPSPLFFFLLLLLLLLLNPLLWMLCPGVSVFWNLLKIKPVVSYLLSQNRIAFLFLIVTVFKSRER